MKIYPNPSQSVAYISIPRSMKQGGILSIYNKNGDMVYQQSFSENNSRLIPLDLSEHPNGMYKVTLGNDLDEVSYDYLNLSMINCPVLI